MPRPARRPSRHVGVHPQDRGHEARGPSLRSTAPVARGCVRIVLSCPPVHPAVRVPRTGVRSDRRSASGTAPTAHRPAVSPRQVRFRARTARRSHNAASRAIAARFCVARPVCNPALGRRARAVPPRSRGSRCRCTAASRRTRPSHAHALDLRRDDPARRSRARVLPTPHPRRRHPARQAALGVRARPPRRPHDRRAGHRRREGARPLRARARPRLHHDRPPAVPLVHPDGADQGRHRVRPRRLGERALRRLLARGRRRGLRRERGARRGWPASSGCRRPPAASSCRAARSATSRRSSPPASTRVSRVQQSGADAPARWKVVCSAEAHSSIASAARVMDVEVVPVRPGDDGMLRGEHVRAALEEHGASVFAVVATAGSTNFGIVDDVASIAALKERVRLLAARRRRLRARRDAVAARAAPLRGRRARRLGDRRPAQVAVRAVRRVRPHLPRPRDRAAARTRSTPSTSTRSPRPPSGARRTTPRTSPGAPAACRSGSRSRPTAATPTARRSRARSSSRRTSPARSSRARGSGSCASRSSRSSCSSTTAGPARTTRAWSAPAARRAARVRDAELARGPPEHALRDRQSEDDVRAARGHPRHDVGARRASGCRRRTCGLPGLPLARSGTRLAGETGRQCPGHRPPGAAPGRRTDERVTAPVRSERRRHRGDRGDREGRGGGARRPRGAGRHRRAGSGPAGRRRRGPRPPVGRLTRSTSSRPTSRRRRRCADSPPNCRSATRASTCWSTTSAGSGRTATSPRTGSS